MLSILIQLDDAIFKALNQVAPAAERKRMEFVRQAVREAIRKAEFAGLRKAYLRQPDSAPKRTAGPPLRISRNEAVRDLVG